MSVFPPFLPNNLRQRTKAMLLAASRRLAPRYAWAVLSFLVVLTCAVIAAAQEWPTYGGDPGGQRFSSATEITPENVAHLVPAWVFHTGEQRPPGAHGASFEDTPVLAEDKLLVCTPTDRVIALNPLTGHEVWQFDPKLPADLRPANDFLCRGVAVWHDDAAAPGTPCRARVVLTTLDARVIELDLRTGRPCDGFGDHGTVALPTNPRPLYPGELTLDSPAAVLHDTLIVGSAVDDMTRVQSPGSGIRGLDARSGVLRWQFNPAPRHEAAASDARLSGGGNVWAPIAVDPVRDRVFLPTASPSAAFWGGERPGDDMFASSVVTLDGLTGKLIWSFQTTHHDIWDYDVAAQPSVITVRRNHQEIRAVVVATKMGLIFVLNEDTGSPVFPVKEQPVPSSDVPDEATAPTQPIPVSPPPLVPQRLGPDDAWGIAFVDRVLCRWHIERLRGDGLYTPPSLRGSIIYPFTGGGVNWGGGAFYPKDNLFVVNSMNLVHVVRLIRRADYDAARMAAPKAEIGRAIGTPYAAERSLLTSVFGLPCNAPPWGTLAAVDLAAGTIRWQVSLGTKAMGLVRGLPNLGGPIVTASGIVFIAATIDDKLRAFDVATGKELWQAALPAGGQATPMTYVLAGRQFVVIAAGGHARLGAKFGDAIVAFALPMADAHIPH
jgi:quinoprotein glucose dehydrogenase